MGEGRAGREDFGFDPQANRWIVGGLEAPLPAGFTFTTHPRPDDVDVTLAPPDRTLSDMLDRGEIDALFASNVPTPYLAGSPNIATLFPDHEARERDWFRRTGIFPMMHTVVVRRELVEAHPGLAKQLYQGFLAAKDVAVERYRDMRRLFQVTTMVPWMFQLFEENRALLGDDWFPCGVAANRAAMETFVRYSGEQGLTSAPDKIEELFIEDLRGT